MTLKLCAANLGHAITSTAAAMNDVERWLSALREEGTDLVFAQEMPRSADWTDTVEEHGFTLRTQGPPQYRCRSGILVSHGGPVVEQLDLPTASYHGSYLAAATMAGSDLGQISLVSAHASPTKLAAAQIATWPHDPPLSRRDYGAATPHWDSDYVLRTLGTLAERGPLLAAGDFNEARSWDLNHPGTWGEDWFVNAAALGLHDVTHGLWGKERATSRGYQIDHVFVSSSLAGRVRSAEFGPHPGADHESLMVILDF